MCEIISAGLKVIAGDMFLSFSTVHVAYYSANILNECTGVKQKILGATHVGYATVGTDPCSLPTAAIFGGSQCLLQQFFFFFFFFQGYCTTTKPEIKEGRSKEGRI